MRQWDWLQVKSANSMSVMIVNTNGEILHKWERNQVRSHLCFQKRNIFVNRSPAQITNSCQFADVELSALVGGVVPKESRRKVIHGNLRPPDLLPLFPCVCHPRPHTGADHSQFQLTECGLFEAEYRLHTSFCIS